MSTLRATLLKPPPPFRTSDDLRLTETRIGASPSSQNMAGTSIDKLESFWMVFQSDGTTKSRFNTRKKDGSKIPGQA
jgi:hypothetical protein